jgi:hypothetical protein
VPTSQGVSVDDGAYQNEMLWIVVPFQKKQ